MDDIQSRSGQISTKRHEIEDIQTYLGFEKSSAIAKVSTEVSVDCFSTGITHSSIAISFTF